MRPRVPRSWCAAPTAATAATAATATATATTAAVACPQRTFNSRVHEIASAVSRILTAVYKAIYLDGGDNDELLVKPHRVHAIEELATAYTSGLVPQTFMTSLSMATLGFSSTEIDAAIKEMKATREAAQTATQTATQTPAAPATPAAPDTTATPATQPSESAA